MDSILAGCSSIIAVPARFSSSRLPRKVMAGIAAKTMQQHLQERCREVRGVQEVVACSGSERLASVVAELVRVGGCSAARTLVINVQGDQPCLDPGIVEQMIREAGGLCAGGEHSWVPVITPVYPLGAGKLHDPNVVKVLRAAYGWAIIFSLSAIPRWH